MSVSSSMHFEVQRLWTVWPLKDAQAMHTLFRQSSESRSSSSKRISNVFVVPGHVFMSICSPDMPQGNEEDVHVFDNAARSRSADGMGPSHGMFTADGGPSLVGGSKKGLWSGAAPLVAACVDPSTAHQVYLIDNLGIARLWQYSVEKEAWSVKKSHKLKTKGPLTAAVLIPNQQCVVWCEREKDNEQRCSIKQQKLYGSEGYTVLEGCPESRLFVIGSSVCIYSRPSLVKGFFYVWHSKDNILVPFLWGSVLPLSLCSLKPPYSHLKVVRTIAGVLARPRTADETVVALAAQPVLDKMVLLSANGVVYQVGFEVKPTQTQKLVAIVDFHEHFPHLKAAPPGGATTRMGSSSIQDGFELFSFQTYIGILHMGVVRLYDVHSGEMVWSYDDHEGSSTRLWRMEGRVPAVGLWTEDGLWVIRSGRICDQAEFLVKGQFPVTTNADGTTPWDYLHAGQLCAARLCDRWRLTKWSTKYALDQVYEMVVERKIQISKDSASTGVMDKLKVTEQLLDLSMMALQNPGLLVALLADHPACQHAVAVRVKGFLEHYHSISEVCVSRVKTPFNREVVPLLEDFIKLHQQYLRHLDCLIWKESSAVAVKDEVKEILHSFYKRTLPLTDSAAVRLKAQFERLLLSSPRESLQGVREYLGIRAFAEACQNIHASVGDHDWRSMLSSERSTSSYSPSLDANQPTTKPLLFEGTCRLLYSLEPNELVPFIVFMEEACNCQSKHRTAFHRQVQQGFLWQRALDALPLEPPARRVGQEEWQEEWQEEEQEKRQLREAAVKAKCQIIVQSEVPNCQAMALRLLLQHQMWREAVDYYESVAKEDLPQVNTASLYQCLLTSIIQGGVYNEYFEELTKSLPPHFNIAGYISCIGSQLPQSSGSRRSSPVLQSPVFVGEDEQLVKVGQVREILRKLLSTANVQ